MSRRSKNNNLKRTAGKRPPKQKFILFCEGAKTEHDYFKSLEEAYCGTLVEIKFSGGVGVPKTVAEKASEEAKRLQKSKRNSFEENDEVWAVFDRDEHESYEESIVSCKNNGVSVAHSNPCFELWLYLHIGDYDKPCNHKSMQKDFSKICPEYTLRNKTANCCVLVKDVEKAEQRAEALIKRRAKERDPLGAASTTVGYLTKKIREASNKFK